MATDFTALQRKNNRNIFQRSYLQYTFEAHLKTYSEPEFHKLEVDVSGNGPSNMSFASRLFLERLFREPVANRVEAFAVRILYVHGDAIISSQIFTQFSRTQGLFKKKKKAYLLKT